MGFSAITLDIIKEQMDRIAASSSMRRRMLSLGYPDLLVNPAQLREIFNLEADSNLTYHPDSQAIIKWHGIGRITDQIVEAQNFFEVLGWELDVVDISRARGFEIVADLNEPLPDQLLEQYDLVIDSGTIEHCFNVGQAMKNLASTVKEGGLIFQATPLNSFNHGFYNMCPTFYYDFYEENGFAVEWLRGICDSVFSPKLFELPKYQRFKGVPENSALIAVVRRKKIQPIKWPVQFKYRVNPSLHG